jgi:hypothetical protein
MSLRLEPAGGDQGMTDQFVSLKCQEMPSAGGHIGEQIFEVLLLMCRNAKIDDLRLPGCIQVIGPGGRYENRSVHFSD